MHRAQRLLERALFPAALSAAVLAANPDDVAAQYWVPNPASETTFIVGLEKPFLPDVEGVGFFTTVLSLDVLFPVGDGLTLQLGAPLGIATGDAFPESSLYLGNLRANLIFGSGEAPSAWVGLGGLTAASISGGLTGGAVGLLSDFDQLEDWPQDILFLRGGWLPSTVMQNGAIVGLRLGGAVVTDNEFDSADFFARVGGWLRFPMETVNVTGSFITSYQATGDGGFGEQLYAYIDIEVASRTGPVSVFVRAPVDGDGREVLDASIGFRLRFD